MHAAECLFSTSFIDTTIALLAGKLARVMTPVSPLKRPVISVHLLQMTKEKNSTQETLLKETKGGH